MLILALLTGLAFWLQITWLYTALGVILVGLFVAQSLSSPAHVPVVLHEAPKGHQPQREVVVVQQAAQPAGMGIMEVLMGTLMAHSVMASKTGPSTPFKMLDSRLEKIEHKLDKAEDGTT